MSRLQLLSRVQVVDGYDVNHWEEEPIKLVIKAMLWNAALYNDTPLTDWKMYRDIMDLCIQHHMGDNAAEDYSILKGTGVTSFWTSFRDGSIKIHFHLIYTE